jgi:hypothetical protein
MVAFTSSSSTFSRTDLQMAGGSPAHSDQCLTIIGITNVELLKRKILNMEEQRKSVGMWWHLGKLSKAQIQKD